MHKILIKLPFSKESKEAILKADTQAMRKDVCSFKAAHYQSY